MNIRSVRHRGLRRLIVADDSRAVPADMVVRVRNVLAALILAENLDSFISDAPPGWRIHRLSGDRRDEWSVSVTRNWRITFVEEDGQIGQVNLEDYH